MKVYNYTDIDVPRRLIREVATHLGLDGKMPKAKCYGEGLCYESDQLRVVVRPLKSDADRSCYVCGRVDVTTCEHCTQGYILSHALGGLCQAFADQSLTCNGLSRSVSALDSACDAVSSRMFRDITSIPLKVARGWHRCRDFPAQLPAQCGGRLVSRLPGYVVALQDELEILGRWGKSARKRLAPDADEHVTRIPTVHLPFRKAEAKKGRRKRRRE